MNYNIHKSKKQDPLFCGTGKHGLNFMSGAMTVSGDSSKPWTRWWWMGNAVEEKELTRHLEEYARAGFGGVELSFIYGVKGAENSYIELLSPRWTETVRHTLREARRLGLGVDITLGAGWPYGGPMISEARAPRRLKIERTPRGGYSVKAEATGQQVKRASPGGFGHVMCPYSRDALEEFTRAYETFISGLEELPRCFFYDSFEVFGADWSPGLPEKFRKLRGYEITDRLAELAGAGFPEDSARVLCDYRETLFLSLLEDSVTPWTEWARSRGVGTRYQAHGAPGNLLDLYAAADIPETETFGGGCFDFLPEPRNGMRPLPKLCPVLHKFASSAARLTGRRLVSSETFTLHREHFCGALSEMKPDADRLFLCGVNHIFFHGSTYSPLSAEQWPGWRFYAPTHFDIGDPLWRCLPEMNAYIQRCQSALQNACPESDVLLYFPYHDMASKPGALSLQCSTRLDGWLEGSPFAGIAMTLWENSVGADYVSDRLLKTARAVDGSIRIADMRYKLLAVPKTEFMPRETLETLTRLAGAGAEVVFCGSAPKSEPGLAGKPLNVPRARIMSDAELTDFILEKAGAPCAPPSSGGVSHIKLHSDSGGRVYFVCNMSAKMFSGPFTPDFDGGGAEFMSPADGRREYETADKHGRLHIELKPGESLFIFQPEKNSGVPLRRRLRKADCGVSGEKTLRRRSPWLLEFIAGHGEMPESASLEKLVSWTDLPGEAYRSFSGAARYSCDFEWGDEPFDEALLCFEGVHDAARVKINGENCGAVWCYPFELRVGEFLRPGVNRIEIDVTNSGANRIAALDRAGVNWKTFQDINIINLEYKPFDASKWNPAPSGITGDVMLTACHTAN
jgi:hypothetical protein